MNYVDKEEMLNEIILLRKGEERVQELIKEGKEEIEARREVKPISDRLGEMVLEIATRYASKGNFSGYTWKEDMIAESVLTCCKYLKNFDPDKSDNPFAYTTQIIRNEFLKYIKKQKKHSDIKDICYNSKDKIEENFFTCIGINYQKLME